MIEATDIKKEELQEMARAILCEIYGAAKIRSELKGSERSETEGASNFGLSGGAESLERSFAVYGDLDDLNRRYADEASAGEHYPRLMRGDFLEQRLLRRGAGRNRQETVDTTAAETARNTQMRSGKLSQTDLSEQLSDIFCRDARRYDGAFDRY